MINMPFKNQNKIHDYIQMYLDLCASSGVRWAIGLITLAQGIGMLVSEAGPEIRYTTSYINMVRIMPIGVYAAVHLLLGLMLVFTLSRPRRCSWAGRLVSSVGVALSALYIIIWWQSFAWSAAGQYVSICILMFFQSSHVPKAND